MRKLKLRVQGMHCASCAMNIDEELEDIAGVDEANTSYRKQVTEVVFDEAQTDLDTITGAIRKLGYEPIGS